MLSKPAVSGDSRPYNPPSECRAADAHPKLSRPSRGVKGISVLHVRDSASTAQPIAASIIFANSALGLMPMVRDTT
jgi:hypothetical protein